jgi:hypothetical protein|tara:strand:- start:13644 stop:13853 length:210 start_codon:yes stop_codon:yes gene_type:complete
MKLFDGKKTYIGIAIAVISIGINWKAPGSVSKEELQVIADAGQNIWPQLVTLFGLVVAAYGRIVAKPKS